MTRIAIIGAGVAGLACARELVDAGLKPVVFDKGRGIGGRVATRRVGGGLQFDHGAQHLNATTPEFRSVLDAAHEAGALAPWMSSDGKTRFVGTPGMTGFAEYLGRGADIRQRQEVFAISAHSSGWVLDGTNDDSPFDILVCTAPAPQTQAMVGTFLVSDPGPQSAEYSPCLTLMVAIEGATKLSDATKHPNDVFAWIAKDSAKPRRPAVECWVAQANADWSEEFLETSKDEICALLLAEFLRLSEGAGTDVLYATSHRWRFAFISKSLGVPFLSNDEKTVYAGGDWCLGARVEHAWLSGTAIAQDILACK